MAFVKTKLPCPQCGGSDPVGLNEDGSAYCFSCAERIPSYYKAVSGGSDNYKPPMKSVPPVTELKTYRNNTVLSSDGEFNALTDRKISLETAKKYGVKSSLNTKGEVVSHSYPYYNINEVSGYKVRNTKDKLFNWSGSSQDTGLFGQQLFRDGGKYITITEGECDAMSAYEMLGSKWPVVSLKNGAAGAVKDIKEAIEFIEKFENIIISFDNDTPGREAAVKVARLISPGKAKIISFPEDIKDANDMLKLNKQKDYVNLWWDAKTYTPSGVLNVADLYDEYVNRKKKKSVPYPWAGLNKKLLGMRQGELVTLTGGTGLGKSSVTREIEHWLINTTEDKVGVLALEEDYLRTVDGIMSIEADQKLYIDEVREAYCPIKRDKIYHKLFRNGRVWVHAHFGATDVDEIFSKLRFMIVGCDCKWIVVDHLHMLLSGSSEGDERRVLDNMMHRLRCIVEETGVGMILVSHLRRVDGNQGHENGITVGLSHLRGSQSIAQLSDCVLALERNQQSDDDEEANTTHVRVLKSRYTGDVGMATHLLFNRDTGRLKEIDIEEDELGEVI
jgi:twinkle protein